MVISHKHRYLFIEIPITGSWAVQKELIQLYDGQIILHKHATYPEFELIASEDEKKYFVFASIRHPLDIAVSSYFKLVSDHKGVFSDAEASVKEHKIDYADKLAYENYRKTKYSFESIYLTSKVWERPYSGMIDVSAGDLDYVIRYEQFQEGFAEALRLLKIEQVREVPVTNKTKGKVNTWESMYTPDMIPKVKRIYGPYMKRWGYEFPSEWGGFGHTKLDEVGYQLSCIMKKFYLVHFKQKDNYIANLIRHLNGIMKQRVYR